MICDFCGGLASSYAAHYRVSALCEKKMQDVIEALRVERAVIKVTKELSH